MEHMTPRASFTHIQKLQHMHVCAEKPVRGNCGPGVCVCGVRVRQTQQAKRRVSCAFANNVGLRVPGLISLAVGMRTTGPGLARGVKRRGKNTAMNYSLF